MNDAARTRIDRFFCRLLGADPEAARVLADAVAVDLDRKTVARAERGGNAGITFGDMQVLVTVALAIAGVLLAALTWWLAPRPGLALFVLFSAHGFVMHLYAVTYLQSMMVADEGYRVIASWPVTASTYLTSRLSAALRGSLWGFVLLCGPSVPVLMLLCGLPVVTGLLFALIALCLGPAVMLLTAGAMVLLMRRLEPEEVSVGALLGFVAGMLVCGRLMTTYSMLDRVPPELLAYAHLPGWWPATWLAGTAALGVVPVPIHHVLLTLLLVGLLPVLCYRMVVQSYTRSLARARRHKGRARGAWWIGLLTLRSARPADRALAMLCVAHGRADWRFRAQLYLLPLMTAGLLISPALEMDVAQLFADPLAHDGWFNPCMLWLIVVAFPPAPAVPLLASSKDHAAAWFLRLSPVPRAAFAAAERHVMRVVFVAPLLVLLTVCYLVVGTPLLSIAAHLVMMALVAEVMVCGMQTLFADYPFSVPNDDEAMMMKMLPVFFVYEVLSMLVAGLIYNVLYRWWWAYLSGALLLLVMRHFFLRGYVTGFHAGSDAAPAMVPEATVPAAAPACPVIAAAKAGRYFTLKLLLEAGHRADAVDAEGRTALDHARLREDARMIALLEHP